MELLAIKLDYFAGWLYRLARMPPSMSIRGSARWHSLMTLAEGMPARHWTTEREALLREEHAFPGGRSDLGSRTACPAWAAVVPGLTVAI